MSTYLYIIDPPVDDESPVITPDGQTIALGEYDGKLRYLSTKSLDNGSLVGQWDNSGTLISVSQSVYEQYFQQFGNVDDFATGALDFHHWQGHGQREMQTGEPVGRAIYPVDDQAFTITMRRVFVAGGGWPGWYWEFIIEFADPNRDAGVRTVAIYDENWVYQYTVGGLIWTDTGEVDEDDQPIFKWMGSCPAGRQTAQPEDIYYSLLWASVIEGKQILAADQSERVDNFWEADAGGGGGGVLDLDGDGLPDTLIYENVPLMITEDADSINIDFDGDGVADTVIPK